MKQADARRVIREHLDRLRPSLSKPCRREFLEPAVAVKFTVPAMLPGVQYEGLDLTDLMLPEPRGTDEQVALLFSQLAYAKLAPDLLEDGVQWNVFGNHVRRFIGDSLERCVLWASRRPGCELVHSPTTLMLHGSVHFGINECKVTCTYDEWLPTRDVVSVDLTQPTLQVSRDPAFIKLYLRAQGADRLFLAAARMAYGQGFDSMAPWLSDRRSLTSVAKKASEVLVSSENPVLHLYTLMVPNVLAKRTFYRMFGCPDRWITNPSQQVRERMYLKLLHAGLIDNKTGTTTI